MRRDPTGPGRSDPSDESDEPDAVIPDVAGDLAEDPSADAESAAREALSRARRGARDKGLRPGMKPLPRGRRLPGAARRATAGEDRDPATLGDQVSRLLADRGWSADVTVGSVLGRWAEIVGPDVAAHVRPLGFESTHLTVQADSSAWATQMRLLTSVILGRIDAEVGPGVVTEFTVRGPAAPSWVKGRRRVRGEGPRDTYG